MIHIKMKTIKLSSGHLFVCKQLKKHGSNPNFYWDFETLNQYHPEVAHTVYCLLRKRWYHYFNVSEQYHGYDMDLDGNVTTHVEKWLDYLNDSTEHRNVIAYRLAKEALVGYVPGQPMNSWVGTDMEFLKSYNEIFSALCPDAIHHWAESMAELSQCPKCGQRTLKYGESLHVFGDTCTNKNCDYENLQTE